MPTIVMASSKGGVGKSTNAVLLATELAQQGASVTLIDADPNRPLVRWAKKPGKPENLRVIDGVTEHTIMDVIDQAARETAFVVVDLEGTASLMVGFAVSRADLVVIPSQGSLLDALEAGKAVKLLKLQEQSLGRHIPGVVVITRTSPAIRPRTLRYVEEQLAQAGMPVLPVHIHERDAFKALFIFGGALSTLDPTEVRNIDAATANARAFVREVLKILKSSQKAAA